MLHIFIIINNMSINWTDLNFESNINYQEDEPNTLDFNVHNLSCSAIEDDKEMLQFGDEIFELVTNASIANQMVQFDQL